METDYKGLGLKVGIEIHQELDTKKLFCNCPSELREENPEMLVRRRLRPTQSEMGEIDRAALAESLKEKSFDYELYPKSVCLVELDDEPPHLVNDEALDVALEVSMLLNAKPVDEIHTMRKIVIDGSNTCGFQRTTLVSTDGFIDVGGERFTIGTICLEEDAARKMGESENSVNYRLDRLGIPLVEIATGADFYDPKTPATVALYIGQLLRATGKVKRGIGTIRQDINISIVGGSRQEIKGIQDLKLIPEVIEREVQRQVTLLHIMDELKQRGASMVEMKVADVSEVFNRTDCHVIKKALKRGDVVYAVRLPKFAGLVGYELQPGRRFGTELADQAKLYGKVAGIFHTDELPRFGISQEEVDALRSMVSAARDDAVVIVADSKIRAEAAIEAVVRRANQVFDGVPKESRRALPDGCTEFMRPLPGAGRMYPETDIPPIPITKERLAKVKRQLPERPEKRIELFVDTYGLSHELAERMAYSDNLELFEELIMTSAEPTLIAATLEETIVSLRREGVKVDNVKKADLEEIFYRIASGKLSKEAIRGLLKSISEGTGVEESVQKLGLSLMDKSELERIVADVVVANIALVKSRGLDALGALMGIVMENVRGKADGKVVHELLENEIKSALQLA